MMATLCVLKVSALAVVLGLSCADPGAGAQARGAREIWISRAAIRALPDSGPAWDALLAEARRPIVVPDLSDQEDGSNVRALAKALVYVRTGEERYRDEVVAAVRQAIGTEQGGRTLALGRNLVAYVIAADLVVLPEAEDREFRAWLDRVRRAVLDGRTLVSTHERRPNNWGTQAGASRMAAALYLGDADDFCRAARVFRGWLGDRDVYAGFKWGRDLSWQADARKPVGINPAGALRQGHSIDGVLPDDQRRAGSFAWPPPVTNYAYGALGGALAQAVILQRQGYDAWQWQDRALLRAFAWLNDQASFPSKGDDTWQPHLINHVYGTHFPAPLPSRPGKNVGFTDWTHGKGAGAAAQASAEPRPDFRCRFEAD
jgi:hypothetical protein